MRARDDAKESLPNASHCQLSKYPSRRLAILQFAIHLESLAADLYYRLYAVYGEVRQRDVYPSRARIRDQTVHDLDLARTFSSLQPYGGIPGRDCPGRRLALPRRSIIEGADVKFRGRHPLLGPETGPMRCPFADSGAASTRIS